MFRLIYWRLQHLFDRSWLRRGWRGYATHYAFAIIFVAQAVRFLMLVCGSLWPQYYFEDPILILFVQRFHLPVSLIGGGLSITLIAVVIEVILASTFCNPKEFFGFFIKDTIFNLEQGYVLNLTALKEAKQSDDDVLPAAMSLTVHRYRSALFPNFNRTFVQASLTKINRLERICYYLVTIIAIPNLFIFLLVQTYYSRFIRHYHVLFVADTLFLLVFGLSSLIMAVTLLSIAHLVAYFVIDWLRQVESRLVKRLATTSTIPLVRLTREFRFFRSQLMHVIVVLLKLNESSYPVILNALVFSQIPTNLFMVNSLVLLEIELLFQYLTLLSILAQTIAILIVCLSVANVSKCLHTSRHLYCGLQARLKGGRTTTTTTKTKWNILVLYELIHSTKVYSLTVWCTTKITRQVIFEMFLVYTAYLFAFNEFIKNDLQF